MKPSETLNAKLIAGDSRPRITAEWPSDVSPQAQYGALVNEYDTAYKAAIEALTKAKNDEERAKASLRRPQPHELAPRFFALAEKNIPGDPAAIDALTWIASNCLFGPNSERAAEHSLWHFARFYGPE